MLSSSSAVSPSPAMSAAIASRRSPSRMASAMKGSSSTISTRIRPRCYEPAPIAGISKSSTCWQHHDSLTGGMTYSEPARTTNRRIPTASLPASLVVVAAISAALGHQLLASSSSTAASPIDALRGERSGALGEAGGAVPDGAKVFDEGSRPWPTSTPTSRCPARCRDGCRGRRGRALRQQWMAFSGVPEAALP